MDKIFWASIKSLHAEMLCPQQKLSLRLIKGSRGCEGFYGNNLYGSSICKHGSFDSSVLYRCCPDRIHLWWKISFKVDKVHQITDWRFLNWHWLNAIWVECRQRTQFSRIVKSDITIGCRKHETSFLMHLWVETFLISLNRCTSIIGHNKKSEENFPLEMFRFSLDSVI